MDTSPPASPSCTNYIHNFHSLHSLYLDDISDTEIIYAIAKLKNTVSAGHDNINANHIKIASIYLYKPLKILYNNILCTEDFPLELKTSKIIPILKNGNHNVLSNYRPIAITSTIAKIFEYCILSKMNNYIKRNQILNPKQFGFTENSNTTTALTTIINDITLSVDDSLLVNVLFLDLSKAFDSIDHNILLNKLQNYGFRGKINNILRNYLTKRLQYVSHNNHSSSFLTNKQGVPQGSILGPLLFNLYLNDIFFNYCKSPDNNQSSMYAYADDITVIIKAKNLSDLNNYTHNIISKISTWCHVNGLSINANKTKIMAFNHNPIKNNIVYKINNTTIEYVTNFKLLGVNIDPSLNFCNHVNLNIKQILPMFACLKKNHNYINQQCKNLIYKSLILPKITYAIPIWWDNNKSQMSKLESFNNKIIKKIFNINNKKERKFLTIHDHYRLQINILTYKQINNLEVPTLDLLNYIPASDRLKNRLKSI